MLTSSLEVESIASTDTFKSSQLHGDWMKFVAIASLKSTELARRAITWRYEHSNPTPFRSPVSSAGKSKARNRSGIAAAVNTSTTARHVDADGVNAGHSVHMWSKSRVVARNNSECHVAER